MSVHRYFSSGGLIITLVLILSACRSQDTPGVTPTGAPPQPSLEITNSPQVVSTEPMIFSTATAASGSTPYVGPESPTATGDAYPQPQLPTASSVAYPYPLGSPGPGSVEHTSTPDGAYPTPFVYPTLGSAYPLTGFTPTPIITQGPYPGPGTTPVSSPLVTPFPTPTPASGFPTSQPTQGATPTPTRVPTATLTPSPTAYLGTPGPTPDSTLLATDPESVRLVSGKVQIIEFFAFWCSNCRMMAPVMNALEAEYGRQVNFVYLDIDDPDVKPFKDALHFTVPRWGVEPNFYLVDEDGKVLKVWIGLVSANQLRQYLNAALK